MKTLIVTFCLGLTSFMGNAQVFNQNNVILDVYYGFPNWFTLLNQNQTTGISSSPNKITGFGPMGVRGEFMISELIGIGVDLGINRSTIVEDYSYYDGSSNLQSGTVESRTQKIGGIVTFNFHPIKKDRIDIAVVAGLGYGLRTYDTEFSNQAILDNNNGFTNSSGEVYNFFKDDENFLGTVTIPFPLAFRIGMTMRYFFTENIGMNIGVGAAHGGILNLGVSAKF